MDFVNDIYFKKNNFYTLAGVAQWTECRPAHWKVADSIPGQGTRLGCRRGPQLGACRSQPVDVSLTLMFSRPPFLLPFSCL